MLKGVSINVYWPVYKRLEAEVINLMRSVSFSDDQVGVYSIRNAELIFRCAVEIESISKDLYEQLGGDIKPIDNNGKIRELYFDTDCIALLDDRWKIGAKEIQVVSPESFFVDPANRVLTPLYKANKRGASGCDWKRAYQALKHSRVKSIKCATIKNLLRALGALFILNVYAKNESFPCKNLFSMSDFDASIGSEMFAVRVFDATHLTITEHLTDAGIANLQDAEKCIYIKKYAKDSVKAIETSMMNMDAELRRRLRLSPKVHNFCAKNPGFKSDSLMQLAMSVGGIEFLREMYQGLSPTKAICTAKCEIVINKGGAVYA